MCRRCVPAGRAPKTLQWHQTSLGALRRYLWRQFHLTDVGSLTRACLQAWVSDLPIVLSVRTGATRTVSTVAAYARSARAFCNWLVRQGYVSETLFPQDAVPKAQRGLPQAVEPEAFVRLLRACQLTGSPGGQNAGMTARNRAILWLLLDTGLQVSELCGLRLTDVDRAGGTVTVRGKRGHLRTFPLSADGQRAVCAYLDQARLTSAWEPAVPEAQDRLLLTERRHPLTKNSLTLLFKRLSQRAGFTRTTHLPVDAARYVRHPLFAGRRRTGSLAGTAWGRWSCLRETVSALLRAAESGARGPGVSRGVSVHTAIQARQKQTPEGTRTGERLQTLVVRKERFLENP